MKKLMKISFAIMFALTLGLTSCKDKNNNDVESMEVTDTTLIETDTMATDTVSTLNGENAAGTTSGKMEQVP